MIPACRRPAHEPRRKPRALRCEGCGEATDRPPYCTRCVEQLCEQKVFAQ